MEERVYTLSFEPVYGRKRGLWGRFGQGVSYYNMFGWEQGFTRLIRIQEEEDMYRLP